MFFWINLMKTAKKPLKITRFQNSNNSCQIINTIRFRSTPKIYILLSRIIKWHLYQNFKKKYQIIPIFASLDCRSLRAWADCLQQDNSLCFNTPRSFWSFLFLVWRVLYKKLHFWKWKFWTYSNLLGERSKNTYSRSRWRRVLGQSNWRNFKRNPLQRDLWGPYPI